MGVAVSTPVQSLYKLSDVLQIPLRYDGRGTVSGESDVEYRLLSNLMLPLQLSAEAIFVREQIGVLAYISGNLYIMVAHNPLKGGLSAFLIDSERLDEAPQNLIQKNMNLREAVGAVRTAIVAAFVLQDGQWRTFTLPTLTDAHPLDEREGG